MNTDMALSLTHVSKKYKNFTLEDISFELPKGCVMGLIGRNGAGKSTTIKLILDMIKRDGGEIELWGSNDLESKKADLGVVLDETGFPENFKAKHINSVMKTTFSEWDEEQFFGYLKKFDIDPKKKFKEYSRGMKMKIAIAVALSHNAKLLVLDEATSGLDPIIRDEILDVFYDYISNGENSILISSHIVSDLEKICDYITFIDRGRVIFSEEKDMLKEKCAVVRVDKNDVGKFDAKAILGRKETSLSTELLVDRTLIPHGITAETAGIEDIMLLMSKGGDEE